MAVFTDHVQLPNSVLEDKTHRQDKFTHYCLTTTTLGKLQYKLKTLVHSGIGLGHTEVKDLPPQDRHRGCFGALDNI